MVKNKGIIFVISAPSGSGKTTLHNQLLKHIPGLTRSVSFTTRTPREGERNGVDYYFVSRKRFGELLKKKAFVEHAKVFDNFYGTPAAPLNRAVRKNKDTLLSIDVKGAMNIKKQFKNQSVLVFILPPSFKILEKRLKERRTDSKDEIKKRLRVARKELSCLGKYDYTVINRKLHNAVSVLAAIVRVERDKIKR